MSAQAADETNQLLRLILANNPGGLIDTPFVPEAYAVRDNILFSTSLASSLFAAFAAVSAKQWLLYYRAGNDILSEKREAIEKQSRLQGAEKWRVRLILEMLIPGLLQVSLILFLIGMIDFFWNVNRVLGLWNFSISVIASIVVMSTILVSIYDPDSPFQNPISRMVIPGISAWFYKAFSKLSRHEGLPTTSKQHDRPQSSPRSYSFSKKSDINDQDLIRQASAFILKRADNSKSAGVAAATIPGIASREESRYLAEEVGVSLSNYTLASVGKLAREEPIGRPRTAVEQTVLLARATMHFYVSAPPSTNIMMSRRISSVDWDDWWTRIREMITLSDFTGTELQYLDYTTTATGDPRHSPSAVQLAAILRRYTDPLPTGNPSEASKTVEPYPHAAAFAYAASEALGHVSWASLWMSSEGINMISQRVNELTKARRMEHDLRKDSPYTLISNSRSTSSKVEYADKIWDMYSECSKRYVSTQLVLRLILTSSFSTRTDIQWKSVYDTFDGYSEELDNYLGKPPKLWSALLREVSQLPHDGELRKTGAFHGPSPIIAALVRRLSEIEVAHESDERTKVLQKEGEEAFRTAYSQATALSGPPEHGPGFNVGLPSDWEILRQIANRPQLDPESEFFRYSTIITNIGLEGHRKGEEQRRFLKSHRAVIEAFCHFLSRDPSTYGEATLWLLTTLAQPWFDHDDEAIHSHFLTSNAASGIVRVLACGLTRPPYPGASDVVEKISPLASILLRHKGWALALLEAFMEDSILTSLDDALTTSGRDAPQTTDPEPSLRPAVARFVSYAGVNLIFTNWFENPSPDVAVGEEESVWTHPSVVAAGLRCIQNSTFSRRDVLRRGERLDKIFTLYAATLREGGKDIDARSIEQALARWRNRPTPVSDVLVICAYGLCAERSLAG